MKIYFVRHGLIDYDSCELDADGKAFSEGLDKLITDDIDFIICDSEKRCVDTITPFSNKRNVEIHSHDKSDFVTGSVFYNLPENGNVLICYRFEAINLILSHFDISGFTNDARDHTYEVVISYDTETEKVSKIPTGFKKL